MPPEIVVSGLGVVSPAGIGAEATWRGLLDGILCVAGTQDPAISDGQPCCVAQIRNQDLPSWANNMPMSHACRLALVAAGEAAGHAGLSWDGARTAQALIPLKTINNQIKTEEASFTISQLSVAMGTSKPFISILHFNDLFSGINTHEASRVKKILIDPLYGSAASLVAAGLGAGGTVQTCVTACASGTHAVVRAAQLIAEGQAEQVVCGGADASLQPLWLAAYRQMGVLAGEHPSRGATFACRPFDRTRDGFAVGEGAAVLVLETVKSAIRRGVRPVACLAGWAAGTDPSGLTQLDLAGESLAHVIVRACDMARCQAGSIGAVIAHGTGTVNNDASEAQALRLALGSIATRIPIVSVKGALGHLLGAAGAVETALAVLACRDQRCPGNATLLEADPAFADLYFPRTTFGLSGEAVLKTSLGFGGHLAALVFKPASCG